ncbi:MAG TPA: hypothetical protein VK601_11275, partial [Kofleriaceae bacterium]|nr:hypothetical protein [Kofleriaceae bacterium]
MALALGVFAVWSMVAKKEEPTKPGQASGHTTGSGSSATAALPGQGAAVPQIGAPGPAGAEAPAAAPVPAESITLPFEHFVAAFSTSCGGLTSWQLTDKRYEHDATKGELLPVREKMRFIDDAGKSQPLPASQLTQFPDCGAFDVNFVTAASTYAIPRHAAWKGVKLSPTRVTYTYADSHLEVVKDFTISPETYVVRMELKVTVH